MELLIAVLALLLSIASMLIGVNERIAAKRERSARLQHRAVGLQQLTQRVAGPGNWSVFVTQAGTRRRVLFQCSEAAARRVFEKLQRMAGVEKVELVEGGDNVAGLRDEWKRDVA